MSTTRTILCLLSLLCACASAPPGPPEEVAPEIVARLDRGELESADELFESAARDDDARERLYPLLYESARDRHERGEASGSSAILRFMARQYPGSGAVREALLYSLFVERALAAQPSAELTREIESVLASLEQDGARPPAWAHVVRAQHAIDRGDLRAAREALARFEPPAEELPPELTVYVEDIGRYLASQP